MKYLLPAIQFIKFTDEVKTIHWSFQLKIYKDFIKQNYLLNVAKARYVRVNN